jgi:dipeptidyl aminopeptidase/acylaminoacyl peptidase
MSPFNFAHRIRAPVLLIHGEADNNPGTFPIQSERMYQALQGHGVTARLVMLPHESHGYAARVRPARPRRDGRVDGQVREELGNREQ